MCTLTEMQKGSVKRNKISGVLGKKQQFCEVNSQCLRGGGGGLLTAQVRENSY